MTPLEVQTSFDDFLNYNKTEEPKVDWNKPTEDKKTVERKLNREEKKAQKEFVDTVMYGLSAALIFSPGGWGEDFPKSTIEMANIHRLAQAAKCYDEQKCTMMDAALYMSTCSMVAPLTHEWYKIYMHAFSKSMPDKFKILFEDEKSVKQDAELEANEVDDLNRLRHWIFKHQIEYIKNKV